MRGLAYNDEFICPEYVLGAVNGIVRAQPGVVAYNARLGYAQFNERCFHIAGFIVIFFSVVARYDDGFAACKRGG